MSILSQVIDGEHMERIVSEFSRLGERCYLENAGAALYPQSVLTAINEDLTKNFYMNPHTDKYTRDCIEQVRCDILKHFNTDPSTYTVIFTSGTTQSLKLVVESFQFETEDTEDINNGTFIYLRDNHTSVLGLREIAADKNAAVIHISHEDFLTALNTVPKISWKDKYKSNGSTLFVYPAQSNFNGFKYPIDCVQNIKNGCLNSYITKHLCTVNSNWFVLLDAASYIATSKLDLSKIQPDFVCMSFYKIFGYPTGLGALLVKNTSENILNAKRYFGGGTVDVVLTSEDFHVKRKNLHERFEDGTIPFLSVIALKHCFDTMRRLIPKMINNDVMETISYHTYCLAKDLYHQLVDLRHQNGNKAAILYMDSDFTDIRKQGAFVTFNLLREDGSYIGYAEFQHMADLFNISIRTGCFCNSGSCQRHLNVTNKEMKDMYKAGHKCGDEIDLVDGRPTGAIRITFGYYNTFNDVDKLIYMIYRCFVKNIYRKPHRTANFKSDLIKSLKTFKEDKKKMVNDINYFQNDTKEECENSKIILKDIAIFPIKSCGAFKVPSAWRIGEKGFEYDREWMIVKENGVCLTQKHNTRMCMLRPKMDLKKRVMILNFKGKSPIAIPLDPIQHTKQKDTTFCHSKICTDIVKGYDCGNEVADWISEALEVSFLRLIRQSDSDRRHKNKKNGEETLLSLSNQAQYLLINKATVRWLNEKIQDPLFTDDVELLTDRFRGNLVVESEDALIEREWQRVIIGKHEFKLEGQCARCQMVCIDQTTGEKTVEPLRTISEQFAGKLRFGIYLSYMGSVDGSSDRILKTYSAVKPVVSDDHISR